MKRPLVFLAVLFSCGIAAGGVLSAGLTWLYLCAAGSVLSAVLCRRNNLLSAAVLGLAVFFCGMIWVEIYRQVPKDHISRFKAESGQVYSLRGWVAGVPESRRDGTYFLFRTEEISDGRRKQKCRGDLPVSVRGRLDTGYGKELILEGTFSRPFSRYLRRKGIDRVFRVKTADFARPSGRDKGFILPKLILGSRSAIISGFDRDLSPVCAGIIEAMTIGEEKNIPKKVYRQMVSAGTVHILVVSGSNVGVVALVALLVLKALRVPRRVRPLFCIPPLLVYCFLTGASDPVVRATVMALVFLSAYFIKREPDVYNSCSVSALVILGFNPEQLFNVGFQLSFASVLAIAFFYPRLKKFFRLETIGRAWLRFTAESGLVSFSAWLGTAALIAGYFRMFSWVTVLANILIVPLASLILLTGFCLLGAQNVSAYLASSFVAVNELLVNLLLTLNTFFLTLPGAYFSF